MKEIDANRDAWALLAKDHYEHFRAQFADGTFRFNQIIERELGDVRGKKLLHLQCNTGADTLYLARKGAVVTGVDLVPENIEYANRLAQDLGVTEARFLASNVLTLSDVLTEHYDIVFTSEGAVIWLPDLDAWARVIRDHLAADGFFYVFDAHPFYFMMDEEPFTRGELHVKYPYFVRQPEPDDRIGGYAGDERSARNYSWMYTMGGVVTALAQAGLRIDFLHEFDRYMMDLGGMTLDADNVWYYPRDARSVPMSFSIKATMGR